MATFMVNQYDVCFLLRLCRQKVFSILPCAKYIHYYMHVFIHMFCTFIFLFYFHFVDIVIV